MSAIPASSVKCSTLVDGTLRIVVEVEPNHALDAFTLFRSPGTPMALAALKIDGAGSESKSAQAGSTVASGQYESAPPLKEGPRRKLGPICEWLVMRCKEPEFQLWAANREGLPMPTEAIAADFCRRACEVESRKDIDGDAAAEALFRRRILRPWEQHCDRQALSSLVSRRVAQPT